MMFDVYSYDNSGRQRVNAGLSMVDDKDTTEDEFGNYLSGGCQ